MYHLSLLEKCFWLKLFRWVRAGFPAAICSLVPCSWLWSFTPLSGINSSKSRLFTPHSFLCLQRKWPWSWTELLRSWRARLLAQEFPFRKVKSVCACPELVRRPHPSIRLRRWEVRGNCDTLGSQLETPWGNCGDISCGNYWPSVSS